MTDPDSGSSVSEVATLDPRGPAEKIDDLTVHLHTRAPETTFPNDLVNLRMMSPQTRDPATQPIGTGPYVVESYRPGGDAVLAANPRYAGETPQITRVTIKYVTDDSTRIQALRAGEVDLVPLISPDLITSVDYFAASRKPTTGMILRLNTYQPPLDDVRVRRALNHAIDADAIAERLYLGYAQPQNCQLLSTVEDGDPSLRRYAYDPERAKALVEEAGAVGRKVVITGAPAWALARPLGEVLTDQMSQTGLDVSIQMVDPSRFFPQFFRRGAEGLQLGYISGSAPTGTTVRTMKQMMHTDGVISTFTDPRADAAFAKVQTTFDSQERQRWIDEVLRQSCDEAAFAFSVEAQELYGLGPRLRWEPGAGSTVGRLAFSSMTVVE
jgi:peptide/nickel transport system substrate-binding protein